MFTTIFGIFALISCTAGGQPQCVTWSLATLASTQIEQPSTAKAIGTVFEAITPSGTTSGYAPSSTSSSEADDLREELEALKRAKRQAEFEDTSNRHRLFSQGRIGSCQFAHGIGSGLCN